MTRLGRPDRGNRVGAVPGRVAAGCRRARAGSKRDLGAAVGPQQRMLAKDGRQLRVELLHQPRLAIGVVEHEQAVRIEMVTDRRKRLLREQE